MKSCLFYFNTLFDTSSILYVPSLPPQWFFKPHPRVSGTSLGDKIALSPAFAEAVVVGGTIFSRHMKWEIKERKTKVHIIFEVALYINVSLVYK